MRLYLELSKNRQFVPFNYHSKLVGTVHKWLGENDFHDNLSLYSFSWLTGGIKSGNSLDFNSGAKWFISSPDHLFIRKILKGVTKENSVCFGMEVINVTIRETPNFTDQNVFSVGSPVFIKRNVNDIQKFYNFHDEESGKYLTETLKTKLKKMNLNFENVTVEFDKEYLNPKIKGAEYNGIKNIGSICPIIIDGSSEQKGFAWDVGVGNSTGIGFGSLI